MPKNLFTSSKSHWNIDFSSPYLPNDQLSMYARQFHRSGKALVYKLYNSNGYNDLDACPIIFLYRHAIELYLKGALFIGNKITKL